MIKNCPAGIDIIGKGTPLVFLHSSLSTNKQWLMAIKVLSEHFTCINVDICGYGRAPEVFDKKHYSFTDEIDRIKDTIEAIGLAQQPIRLVGHSCGGAIALAMAVKLPEQIAGIALFEPVAFHLLKEGCASYYQQIHDFAMHLKNIPNDQAAQAFVNFWNPDGFFQSLPDKVQRQMANSMDKVHLDFQGILAETYQLHDLARITCPALVMVGKHTQPVSKVLSNEICQHLPKAQMVELPGGHMAPISHEEQVSKQLIAFLKA